MSAGVLREYRRNGATLRAIAEHDRRHAGRSFVGADCTLDGAPATVCGALCDFATVATLPNGPAYEYAWETVAYVMTERDGAFRS